MSGLLSGKKFSSKHQTYLQGSKDLLKKLKDMDEVKKIALGEINRAKPAERRVKVRGVNGNFICLLFRDVGGTQVLNVTSIDPEPVINFINNYKWSNK